MVALREAFITGTGAFLPGQPIGNDRMDCASSSRNPLWLAVPPPKRTAPSVTRAGRTEFALIDAATLA